MPVAKKFEALCSVAFRNGGHNFIPIDVFKEFSIRGIAELEFDYTDFLELKPYQLISSDSASGFDMKVGGSMYISIVNEGYLITALMPDPDKVAINTRRVNAHLFTPAGNELCSLISTVTPEFVQKKIMHTFCAPNWSIVATGPKP